MVGKKLNGLNVINFLFFFFSSTCENGRFECEQTVENCTEQVICPNNLSYFEMSSMCHQTCGKIGVCAQKPFSGCGCKEGFAHSPDVSLFL